MKPKVNSVEIRKGRTEALTTVIHHSCNAAFSLPPFLSFEEAEQPEPEVFVENREMNVILQTLSSTKSLCSIFNLIAASPIKLPVYRNRLVFFFFFSL